MSAVRFASLQGRLCKIHYYEYDYLFTDTMATTSTKLVSSAFELTQQQGRLLLFLLVVVVVVVAVVVVVVVVAVALAVVVAVAVVVALAV